MEVDITRNGIAEKKIIAKENNKLAWPTICNRQWALFLKQ
jgi:hypothetical protein